MNKLIALMFAALVTIGGAGAKEIYVKEHVRKDGTKVAGYTRTVKDKNVASETIEVKGYTKKDGTKVAGYTRKKTSKDK